MLQADRYDLKTIFEKQRQYRVPLFQRRYVWDREKQWEPLWEDVKATAERYMESIAENAAPQPHFLGAVVLKQESTISRSMDARSIIDGQQRLITLQLIIAAARDMCHRLGDTAKQHYGDLNFLVENSRGVNQEDDKFKVWPTQVDHDDFRRVMSAGSPEAVRKAYQNLPPRDDDVRVRDAYLYFYESIKVWLAAASDDDQRLKRLDALRDAIYTGLILVLIDLSQDDDPQLIFESLNARGTPLLESELVKNFLLHMAESKRMDSKALYDKYWSVFERDEDEFWQREVKQGRLYRARVEIFLQHYLTMRTRQEVSATKLFDTFKAFVGKQNNDPELHLASLRQYGDIFYSFYNAPPNTPEKRFFDRINTLDITTVFPLLLLVFDKYQMSNAEPLHTFLLDLESFFVRRMICSLTTRNYNRLMLDLQSQLQANDADLATTTRLFLLGHKADSERWPDDDEFQKAFVSEPLYSRINRARLLLVLQALELQLRTAKSEKVTLPGKLTIEHLLPQAWERNWPLPKQTPEAEEEREAVIHTIGNLTLVTGSLNPALSNAAWSGKRPEILKHSTLLLNHYFQHEPEWAEDEIRIRSRDLFNTAKMIWPRPS
jgi:uncharacterized protein with ParB-like and HNH nuclease domain